MKTSYFTRAGYYPNAISIAGKAPDWFTGRQYKKLAPKYWFWEKYKQDGDWEYYTEQYYKEILDKLDPLEVWNELGENCILLCWENPNKHCHRFLVAQWLKDKLGKEVEEL